LATTEDDDDDASSHGFNGLVYKPPAEHPSPSPSSPRAGHPSGPSHTDRHEEERLVRAKSRMAQ